MIHWLHWYWGWAGGNIGSVPACGAEAVVFAVCFRKPAAAWWHRHFGAKADLAEIKAIAESGQRIAADLFEHHVGRAHPDAPSERKTDGQAHHA